MTDTFIHSAGNQVNSALFTHLVTGAPRNIYIHDTCPNSADLGFKVQTHGGIVVASQREAHIILADYTADDFYPKIFNTLNTKAVKAGEKIIASYAWLNASIAANQMLEFTSFKADPPKRKYKKRDSKQTNDDTTAAQDGRDEPQPVASTSAASAAPLQPKKTRQTFDADDDARLVRFFAKFGGPSMDGQARSVTAIARLLADQYPEHSWESWRERYKRAQGGPTHWGPLIEDMRQQMTQDGYVSPDEINVDLTTPKRAPPKQKTVVEEPEPDATVHLHQSHYGPPDMHLSNNDIELNPLSNDMPPPSSHDDSSLQFPPSSSAFEPPNFPIHSYDDYTFFPSQPNIDPQLQNMHEEQPGPPVKRRRVQGN